METITTKTILPPQIHTYFDKNLLSFPVYKFSADELMKIAQFIVLKACSNEFKNLPNTFDKIELKYCEFARLYDEAKGKEAESKGKTFVKTSWPFYRPRFGNNANEHLFERLDDRRQTSERIRRKNNKVPKV